MNPTVAVIDIGSNSIKVLVARREADGTLHALGVKTLDSRISAGISHQDPQLGEAGMQRGLAAIQDLVAYAETFAPGQVVLVATSAVRSACNRAEFCALVQRATGHPVRVLSGDEEANLIGRGLTADPALSQWQDFHVFDLGGGSLEWLTFRQRRREYGQSYPLGCVRVTEQLVTDPSAPFTAVHAEAVRAHILRILKEGSTGAERLNAPAIFTGGTMTTVRLMLAAESGATLEQTPAHVPVAVLERIFQQVAPMPLAVRQRVPGLPAARADVFPAALVTMLAAAELIGVNGFEHSLYNLRWGVAAELLRDSR